MLKKYPILKWILIAFTGIIVLLFGFGWWFISLLPTEEMSVDLSSIQASELPYLSQDVTPSRGKILAIVTSTDTMGETDKSTGYELTELSRAYYVFEANGFEVDIASPLGGEPPVVIDDDDVGKFDFAFLNDKIAQQKVKQSIAVKDINPLDYEAVFFAGGKGAMFDFPENKAIQNIIRELYQSNKVIGAVCHGPAALINVILDSGEPLLKNKEVSGFTNEEELLLIPDAETIFPFLLQDKLISQGAQFNEGAMYLENISHDKNLVTGQNPWSTWILAETMIAELGYTPKHREITAEENAMKVLMVYETEGSQKAKELINQMCATDKKPFARQLLASHSVVAAMRGDIERFFGLLSLTSYAKSKSKNI
ncbi:type 1 glutamine amidotransferase domain-containing protein [Aquimarina sp. 2201CG5-10]|uniref:type 1 glutamine amidotransferase domain-containing protein n=1 Tax=Aquimarina callyspongiae TaxID=3098150 RepID=UPI002AB4D839|nr:type 1 glutamine amidotransferase domain-containing protein [Aquimarina sp. 2201CG5-10]MDY8135956.1 type 1 glutamine amidotransferase domain-containing protein [Aquimarina sp. 2201CG5-10]